MRDLYERGVRFTEPRNRPYFSRRRSQCGGFTVAKTVNFEQSDEKRLRK